MALLAGALVVPATPSPLMSQVPAPGDSNGDGVVRLAVLGDSYVSGQGAGYGVGADAYEAGTDDSGNECYRAHTAAGPLIGEALGVADEDFLFAACSGATVAGFLSNPQHPASTPGVPGGNAQLTDLAAFDGGDHATDIVLLGIGGNDVDFTAWMDRCSLDPSCQVGSAPAGLIDAINGMRSGFVQVYETIRNVTAPNAEVYVFGYPVFLGGAPCLATTGIGGVEKSFLVERIRQMNDVIARAARTAGVHYVDIEDVLLPDGVVCGSAPKVRGRLVRLFPLPWPSIESFHPLPAAHEAFAQAFFGQYPAVGSYGNPAPAAVVGALSIRSDRRFRCATGAGHFIGCLL